MFRRRDTSKTAGAAYTIGKGKPPREHQFQPGQSGNPAGRPKGSISLKAAYTKAASALTEVPGVEGGAQEFTLLEAMMINLFRQALAGDQRAVQRLLELGRAFPAQEDGDYSRPVRVFWLNERGEREEAPNRYQQGQTS